MPCIPNMVLSHHLPIGMELGDIAIGQTLLEVGSTFQKIGMLEREYLGDVYNKFFKPFNSHLQVEFNLLVTVDHPQYRRSQDWRNLRRHSENGG